LIHSETVKIRFAGIRIEVRVLLVGPAALVGHQLSCGRINTAGPLRDKGNNAGAPADSAAPAPGGGQPTAAGGGLP